MDCHKARDITDLLLDGSIDRQMELELFIHLNSCESCYDSYQKAHKMQALYRSIPMKPLPEGFHQRLTEKLDLIESEKAVAIAPLERLSRVLSAFVTKLGYFLSNSSQRAVATAMILIIAGFAIIIGGGFTDNPAVTPQNSLLLAYAERPLQIMPPGGKWAYVDRSIILKEGYSVRTGFGRAVLMIGDKATIRMASHTDICITGLDLEKGENRAGVVRLDKGRIWIDETKSSHVQVECLGDLIKPLGTAFQVSIDKNGIRDISCFEGTVIVRYPSTNREFELEEGEKLLTHRKSNASLKEQIEMIDGGILEKDDWIRWNRQLKPSAHIIEGVPLSAPARTLLAKPQRPWESRRFNAENPGPLVLPKNDAQWQRFNVSHRNWRLMTNSQTDSFNGMFGNLSDDSRREIILELKRQKLLADDYPELAMTLPVKVQSPELMEKIEDILEKENFTKEIQSIQEQFANLPEKARIEIIDNLKGRKVLREDFPYNSTFIPPDAVRYMMKFKVRKEQLRIHRITP